MVREKASLQTEVRGVSERVKLLEDIVVAYVKAHGDLIAFLEAPRNRSQLLSAVKNGKAKEILKGAFKEVDRASTRHRAMLKRMHEINDEEMGGRAPSSSGFTPEQQDALKQTIERFEAGRCPTATREAAIRGEKGPDEGKKSPDEGKKDLISAETGFILDKTGVDGT